MDKIAQLAKLINGIAYDPPLDDIDRQILETGRRYLAEEADPPSPMVLYRVGAHKYALLAITLGGPIKVGIELSEADVEVMRERAARPGAPAWDLVSHLIEVSMRHIRTCERGDAARARA